MTLRTLPQQIYDFIVNEIRFGSLPLGQKINEADLMARLSTSRTPLREALIQLASDGILENVPRKGFYVRNISRKTSLEYNAIVAQLDYYAIKKAIPNLDDADYQRMGIIIEDIAFAIASRNYHDYCVLSDKFHAYYYAKSGNDSLPDVIFDIRNQCLTTTYFSKDTDKLFELLTVVNREHGEILKLARENNLAELEKLLILHWTKQDLHNQ
jgi:DNA-binding GntR family transcriptional regulator